VGVLSGPGYCAKNPRHSAQAMSSVADSSVSVSHAGRNDAAVPALRGNNGFLAVQVNLPRQISSTSDV